MNKKLIYNNIMKNVASIVKKRINEEYDDWDDEEYDDWDDEENETGMTFADELAYHFGDEALSDYGYDTYIDDDDNFEDEYFDDVNESANDIYDDDEIFMFDEDKDDDIEFEEETEFYDNQGNWDPIENYQEFDPNTDEGHIYDVVGGLQYIDFTETSHVHLNDADIDIIGIESNGDNISVTLFDTDNDTYKLSDFTDNDIKLIADAVDNYIDNVEY